MTGKLIVFEGIDKSGKETQARSLTNYLRDQNKLVATMSFPNYESWSGQRLKQWLSRQDMNPIAANMLFSLNRYEEKPKLEQYLKDYDYLILDRYYYSNWVYGSAIEEMPKVWLQTLDARLPQPDLVFLLDISGELSQERAGYVDLDIHEQNLKLLNRCREEYLNLVDSHWVVIDGRQSHDKIHTQVCTNLTPLLQT